MRIPKRGRTSSSDLPQSVFRINTIWSSQFSGDVAISQARGGYEVVASLVPGAVDLELSVTNWEGAIGFAAVVVQQINGCPLLCDPDVRSDRLHDNGWASPGENPVVMEDLHATISRPSDGHDQPFLGRGQVAVSFPRGDVNGRVTALRFNGHVTQRASLAVGETNDPLGPGRIEREIAVQFRIAWLPAQLFRTGGIDPVLEEIGRVESRRLAIAVGELDNTAHRSQRLRGHFVGAKGLDVVLLLDFIVEPQLSVGQRGDVHVAGGDDGRFHHIAAQHLASYGREHAEHLRRSCIPTISANPLAERARIAVLEEERDVPALQAQAVGTENRRPLDSPFRGCHVNPFREHEGAIGNLLHSRTQHAGAWDAEHRRVINTAPLASAEVIVPIHRAYQRIGVQVEAMAEGTAGLPIRGEYFPLIAGLTDFSNVTRIELVLQTIEELERVQQSPLTEFLRTGELRRVPVPRVAERQKVVLVEMLSNCGEAIAGKTVEGLLATPRGSQLRVVAVLFPEPITEPLRDILAQTWGWL